MTHPHSRPYLTRPAVAIASAGTSSHHQRSAAQNERERQLDRREAQIARRERADPRELAPTATRSTRTSIPAWMTEAIPGPRFTVPEHRCLTSSHPAFHTQAWDVRR